MNKISTKISKRKKDIIQKYTSGLLRGATLEFYGIKTAKIKEAVNTELQVVEIGDLSTDFIFLLEDDTYQHFEFETSYKKQNLLRFAKYDLYLYERDGRKVNTVVIYSSDVQNAETSLDIGSLTYKPDVIFMHKYDGNAIYTELEAKLKAKQELTDADILNLIFLPLMKSETPKYELAVQSIKLANTIPNRQKRNACIASAFAFTEKYLSEAEIKKILGVLKMTKAIDILIEDQMIELAKKMLVKKKPMDEIIEFTNLDEEIIMELQKQAFDENDE